MSAVEAPRPRGTFAAFQQPDVWHAPCAYWFWHHLPDDAQIQEQVAQMRAAGFRSFQIQARLAFPREEYLGAGFLRACRLAVAAAAAHGMTVGIYDDFNWQTGHAAGLAVAGHDELRERHLFWARVELTDGAGEAEIAQIRAATENLGPAAMAWQYEGGVATWTDWRLEGAWARAGSRAVVDLADRVAFAPAATGCELRVAGAGSHPAVLVLVSARSATSRLINPLDSAAVQRFIDVAYEPFARELGPALGDTVRYMFFDQPHAVYYDWAGRAGDPRSSIPFDAAFGARVTERFGVDAPAAWLAVVEETDAPDRLRLRADFWDLYTEVSMDTFLRPVRDWAHAHGLLQSGHEVLTHVGSWTPGSAFDNFELRANFGLDHFGVDRFRDLTAVDAQDGVGQLGPRLGDAIARASGRSGTMVEQYFMTPPAGGAPWSGHWGLTLDELRTVAIRHHLAGMRQMIFHGFTQTSGHDRDHASLVNPRFDFPPGINFEPWFAGHHAGYADEVARLSEFLDGMSASEEVALLWPLRTFWTHGQVGPHGEHVGAWARALTESGVPFRIVDERQLATLRDELPALAALVLPATRTLAGQGSIDALANLASTGVRIVTSGHAPELVQRGPDAIGAAWRRVGAVALEHAPEPARVRDALGLSGDDLTATLAVHGVLAATGTDADGRVRLALTNVGESRLVVRCGAGATEWEAATGRRRPAHGATLPLEPGELRLLVLDDGALELNLPEPPAALRRLATGWSLQLPGRDPAPVDVAAGWQQAHPTFSGVGVYRATFDDDAARDLTLRLPAVAGAATVHVNGTPVAARGGRPYRIAIPRACLRAGVNEIEIAVAGSAANAFYAGTGLRAAPEPNGLLAVPTLEAGAVDA